MKKMWWLAALLALPLASAAPGDILQGVFDKILSIGSLKFIGISGTVPFTRILIWILTFTLFFAVLISLGAGKNEGTFKYLSRRLAMVVAAVLATISAIFLPAAAILAVGTGWATAVGLILIGTPILGLGYLLWKVPGKDENGDSKETKGTVLFKLILSMLLFWILSAMNNEIRVVGAVPDATVVGTMANFMAWALYIVSLMIIWYVIKFFLTTSGDKEQRWKEGGKTLGEWFKKKNEQQKAVEDMKRRDGEARAVKSYLLKTIDGCEGLVTALFAGVRTLEEQKVAGQKAKEHFKFLRKNLRLSIKALRQLRRKERGRNNEKGFEIFNTLAYQASLAYEAASNIDLPTPGSADWENKKAQVHEVAIYKVRAICGALVQALNQYIEREEIELKRVAASQRTEEQVQEKAQQQAQERTKQQAAQRRERPSRPSVPRSQPRR